MLICVSKLYIFNKYVKVFGKNYNGWYAIIPNQNKPNLFIVLT